MKKRIKDIAYLRATYFEYADPDTVRRNFERCSRRDCRPGRGC